MEQLAAEFTLEAVDLFTQGRLCHMSGLGGAGEVSGSSDGQKVHQLLQLHIDSLYLSRRALPYLGLVPGLGLRSVNTRGIANRGAMSGSR